MTAVWDDAKPFPEAAKDALQQSQMRANVRRATDTIRARRAKVVAEVPEWEALRDAGAELKRRTLRNLDTYLEQLEEQVAAAGGHVHWARDGEEANRIVTSVLREHGIDEVVKVKSLTTDEIGLNRALAEAGITALETDLAELIVQLGDDRQSHILVPAIHRSRGEIRDLFRAAMDLPDLSDDPAELAEAARRYLRDAFLRARAGVSSANFAVAETGTVCVVESEGNGRMCTTLPDLLVSVVGIEKLVPEWRDLDVFLQLLPRSATGEPMSPYTSLWTGVHEGDGPREFHLVLLDNGRTRALADTRGRPALACIRCSACLNACPVYRQTGGHAYGSIYPGPIGAILTPQLAGIGAAKTLPFASTLCGACEDVCPVKIPIPEILVHLRAQAVEDAGHGSVRARLDPERLAMRRLARVFAEPRRYERLQRLARRAQWPLARGGLITRLPGPLAGWTRHRDLPPLPPQTFRDWWRER